MFESEQSFSKDVLT